MANSMNKVLLCGRLGSDPELRMGANGQGVLKLRVATSESYLDRDKVRQERTDWHDAVVFGKRSEPLSRFLHKGSQVLIEGSLRTSSYEAEGIKKFRTEVIAKEVILTGSASGGSEGSSYTPRSSKQYSDDDYATSGDEDIPF